MFDHDAVLRLDLVDELVVNGLGLEVTVAEIVDEDDVDTDDAPLIRGDREPNSVMV